MTAPLIVAAIIVVFTMLFWLWCCLRVSSWQSREEEDRWSQK